uniref:TSA: Wollemia nobilis Ref_Wollemi_Transcript_10509_3085 transcribed RNA sequence n=1 Tax=Wollemia nobilis TaxID=56998 RepID=A0A0C9RMN5_9CONI
MEALCAGLGLGFPPFQAKNRPSFSSVFRQKFAPNSIPLTFVSNRRASGCVPLASSVSKTAGDRRKLQKRRKKKSFPSSDRDGGSRKNDKEALTKNESSRRKLVLEVEASTKESGDPLGRKELSKYVVQWISQGMAAMAAEFCKSEEQGEVGELTQKMGYGIAFVMQAQPFLAANPMPKGLESLCLKASTHYPTLFDHFQRELREGLQQLEKKFVVLDWKETESWRAMKQLTKSGQHRALVRRSFLPNPQNDIGLPKEKITEIQKRIDDFVTRMSELLQIERDAELEATQEELDAAPTPDVNFGSARSIEYLVNHGQSQQEQCDTICNLYAVRSSTGLGGMHLVTFRVEEGHRLPPTTISPGDMVCVRISDSKGAGATSCVQGLVHSLGEDGSSIILSLESRYGDPTFSKLFGKSLRIDRIHSLADAITYERNYEALMLLQKQGLNKKNPAAAVVATLFGTGEDINWPSGNDFPSDEEDELGEIQLKDFFDESQKRAITLGLNRQRPVLVIQGPPGTGKSSVLAELIDIAVKRGERILLAAPSNAAVDNMVERLADMGLNVVRVGNPVRMSPSVVSKSLGSIVDKRLADFRRELARKRADLRNDLRHCLKDDSLAAGIRQLLKQLGKSLKQREKEAVHEILSSAQVVLSTNTGAADPFIRKLASFDLVIIDEAGQAIEPACWIPIQQGKRIILAGDTCQLAPVILSRQALEGGLGVSLLERASKLYGGGLSHLLSVQYRMNDAIASWASKEMYGELLQSSSTVASRLLVDSPFVKATWITRCPLLLLDTRMPYGSLSVGCEEHLDPEGTGSFYNEGEADIVVQHVKSLILAGVLPTEIAVQSPYVAQVQLLRERLDELPEAAGVQVASVDSFQGREAEAVVITMVRSNTLGAIGFLGDSRRINVAITRARKHVAVVCDSSTICHNTFLARLLRHIRHFGQVRHAKPGANGFGLDMMPLLPSIT